MSNKYCYLSFIDFSEEITISGIFDALRIATPRFMKSLEVGIISSNGIRKKYKGKSINEKRFIEGADIVEWYGGPESMVDPDANWRSYLLVRTNRIREVILCGDLNSVSFIEMSTLIRMLSLVGNLGYGFASTGDSGPDIVNYVIGITNKYPSSDFERRQADKYSVWFREKIPMRDVPAKKRYLHGMYRDVYELNVLNISHVSGAGASTIGIGAIAEIGNGSYIWDVPRENLIEARVKLSAMGLIL